MDNEMKRIAELLEEMGKVQFAPIVKTLHTAFSAVGMKSPYGNKPISEGEVVKLVVAAIEVGIYKGLV
jgi:hypothetical protein